MRGCWGKTCGGGLTFVCLLLSLFVVVFCVFVLGLSCVGVVVVSRVCVADDFVRFLVFFVDFVRLVVVGVVFVGFGRGCFACLLVSCHVC